MAHYEQSIAIDTLPEDVFAWLTDVENLPGYLPPVTDASIKGPAAEGSPGQKVRMTLEFPNGSSFDAEGYLATDERERRMEWGTETERDYSGWLTVGNHGEGGSEVIVHLSFGKRSAEGDIQEGAPADHDPIEEGIGATLEFIRRQIEEGSAKVQPPPPPEGSQPPQS